MTGSVSVIVMVMMSVVVDVETSFKRDVAPIFATKCLGCHNERKAAGGLDMSTFAKLRRGGKGAGADVLAPGDVEGSFLVETIRPGAARRMPDKQPPLSASEVATVERWVREGAKFDGGDPDATRIAALVDPLANLPKVAARAAAVEPVTTLAASPDGKRLAVGSRAGVKIIELAAGKVVATRSGRVNALAWANDAQLVIAGGRPGMYGEVDVWNLKTPAQSHQWKGHRDAILGTAVAPGGKVAATCSYDRMVLLWDLESGTMLKELKDHTDAVYAVAWRPDGRMLATASADRTVKLWEASSGTRLETLSNATAELYDAAWSPDGGTVYAGGVDRSLHAWRWSEGKTAATRSVFAHDGAILRVLPTRDGKAVVTTGEDRAVKSWDAATLALTKVAATTSDWPQALAVVGGEVIVGGHDGSVTSYSLIDTRRPRILLASQPSRLDGAVARASHPAPPASKPELSRDASMNDPEPRTAALGQTIRTTVRGNGVGRATLVETDDPGLTAKIVAMEKPDPNLLVFELTIGKNTRVGVHAITAVGPEGVPGGGTFLVERYAETPVGPQSKDAPVATPTTLAGSIDQPGEVDEVAFRGRAGTTFAARVLTKPLGSQLSPVLTVLDDRGRVPARSVETSESASQLVIAAIEHDGVYRLKIEDRDYGGSGAYYYRVEIGELVAATSVWPPGVEASRGGRVSVTGVNFQVPGVAEEVSVAAGEVGTLVRPRVVGRGEVAADCAEQVVLAEGPQAVEPAADAGDDARHANLMSAPGGVSGRVGRDGDVDCYRFAARRGQPLILETYAQRLGTALDPMLEILDARGLPVSRVVLRPLAETNTTFRDHDATAAGIRITNWDEFAVGDLVMIGREVTRIEQLPRNPDDDCRLISRKGRRVALFGTTPEHHVNGQPFVKVEAIPASSRSETSSRAEGVGAVVLPYRNDDGGPEFGKDSYLWFDPPADGEYIARVSDARGQGGAGHVYHLVARTPRPDFRASLSPSHVNIRRGGTSLINVAVDRTDGFAGAIDLEVEGLPAGVHAVAEPVEAGSYASTIGFWADAEAAPQSKATWHVTARASASASDASGRVPARSRTLGGGWVTIVREPNLAVTATPTAVALKPGGEARLTLRVERRNGFAGRVPIDVVNLPEGVRVLDVGLNGVLIPEGQSERVLVLRAERWAAAGTRRFYATGKAEAAGTSDASRPITLTVEPASPRHASK